MSSALGGSTNLYWLILACEVLFWLALGSGLAARYWLRRPRLSRALLFSVPGIDLLLISFTAADLKGGAPVTFAHGLAAAYVGFTVAFGSLAVKWADARFAHWFASGPQPIAAPARGWSAVRYDILLWLRAVVAWTVAVALLGVLITYVNDPATTRPLLVWYRIAIGSVFLWFVFGPIWSLVFFVGKRGG